MKSDHGLDSIRPRALKQARGSRVFYHFACWSRLVLLATDVDLPFGSYNCNKLKSNPLQNTSKVI